MMTGPHRVVVPMFVVVRSHATLNDVEKEFLHAQLTVDQSIWGPRKGCLLFDASAAGRFAGREHRASVEAA